MRKIELSNKIHPYFMGLTDDLLFWAAINTIFLTTVKNFNASQISMLSAVSVFSSIILQNMVFKLIKKIGNIKSVRVGLFLLLLSAIIITVSKKIYIIAIGLIIYHLAFFFTSMGNVILKRNLKAVNKEEEFSKIQSKGGFIYAFLTMIISFISGFVFNINKYLPMIISISICVFNIFLSKFIYECKDEVYKEEKEKAKFKWKPIIILIIIVYGVLYATVETIQENGKIFIQYDLQEYINISKTSIYLTMIISFSRVARVVSNIVFNKIYSKFKGKLIVLLNILIFTSLVFFIIGSIIPYNIIGTGIMGIGFCILLFSRDPIMIFTKTELLNNCAVNEQEVVLHRFNLSRKIIRCFFATLVSVLLIEVDMVYIMIILLIFTIVYFGLTISLYKKLSKEIKLTV